VWQVERRPLTLDLRAWFEMQMARLPARSPTADATRYALNRQDGHERIRDDGRIERHTNRAEYALRPVPLSRHNALFEGSDEGGAN
jgi:hypothetical protein